MERASLLAGESLAGGATAGGAGLLVDRLQRRRRRLELADALLRVRMGGQPGRRPLAAALGDHVAPQRRRGVGIETGRRHVTLAEDVGLAFVLARERQQHAGLGAEAEQAQQGALLATG